MICEYLEGSRLARFFVNTLQPMGALNDLDLRLFMNCRNEFSGICSF